MEKPAVKVSIYVVFAVVIVLAVIQFVPYGRVQSNPLVVREPAWDSQVTRSLAKRACFDCHSNETVWPWYSRIAPVSWLVQHDVNEGRADLNFSEWSGRRDGENPEKIREELVKGDMPPMSYKLMHSDARLTKEEQRQLVDGLAATVNGTRR